MSTTAYVTQEHDINDLKGENIKEYYICGPISLESFVTIMESLEPNNYNYLMRSCITNNLNEVVPDNIVKVLASSPKVSYQTIIDSLKLEPSTVDRLIDTESDTIDFSNVLDSDNISSEHIKTIIQKSGALSHPELAAAVSKHDIELALWILDEWDNHESLHYQSPQQFKIVLFEKLGSTILTDEHCITLFGKVRPSFCTEELREHEPCVDGWKRTIKWAGRNNHVYTWNEFIARHILNNQNDVESAASDLTWLACCVTDDYDFS